MNIMHSHLMFKIHMNQMMMDFKNLIDYMLSDCTNDNEYNMHISLCVYEIK